MLEELNRGFSDSGFSLMFSALREHPIVIRMLRNEKSKC